MNAEIELSDYSPSEAGRRCADLMEAHRPPEAMSELARLGYGVARRAVQDGLRRGYIRQGQVVIQGDQFADLKAEPVTLESLGGEAGIRRLIAWAIDRGLMAHAEPEEQEAPPGKESFTPTPSFAGSASSPFSRLSEVPQRT